MQINGFALCIAWICSVSVVATCQILNFQKLTFPARGKVWVSRVNPQVKLKRVKLFLCVLLQKCIAIPPYLIEMKPLWFLSLKCKLLFPFEPTVHVGPCDVTVYLEQVAKAVVKGVMRPDRKLKGFLRVKPK